MTEIMGCLGHQSLGARFFVCKFARVCVCKESPCNRVARGLLAVFAVLQFSLQLQFIDDVILTVAFGVGTGVVCGFVAFVYSTISLKF
jgi:hypothetical protein